MSVNRITKKELAELGRAVQNDREKRSGILPKYIVWRVDGGNKKGRKHDGCDYYVLDWKHDPFTIPAMKAYAKACRRKYPELAKDILRKIEVNHE